MQVFIIIGVCCEQTGIYLLSVAFSFDIRYNIKFFVGLVGCLMGGLLVDRSITKKLNGPRTRVSKFVSIISPVVQHVTSDGFLGACPRSTPPLGPTLFLKASSSFENSTKEFFSISARHSSHRNL